MCPGAYATRMPRLQTTRPARSSSQTGWTLNCTWNSSGEFVSYSYRSDSTGVISAARWAGYMPAVTVINERVRIEATIEIHETIGCGTKSGKGNISKAAHVPMPNVS